MHVFDTSTKNTAGSEPEPKFPLTPPCCSPSTSRCVGRSVASRVIVEHDARRDGGRRRLYDEVDGGFFRYAASRDWETAAATKSCSTSTRRLLRLYVRRRGGARKSSDTGTSRSRIVRYCRTLAVGSSTEAGAGSQRADSAYYALQTPTRVRARGRRLSIGRCTPVERTDGVGASARGRAARTIRARSKSAMESLERVLLAVYQPGGGVAHYDRRRPRRFADCSTIRFVAIAAALDAYEATGNIVYVMMAEEARSLRAAHDVGREEGRDSSTVRAPRGGRGRAAAHDPLKPFVLELRGGPGAAAARCALGERTSSARKPGCAHSCIARPRSRGTAGARTTCSRCVSARLR